MAKTLDKQPLKELQFTLAFSHANRPVQKEGNLTGLHIHTVCNLHFDHSSGLKVMLK